MATLLHPNISLLLSLCLAGLSLTEGRQLRFVTLVYRHGDRSPIKTYPKDPHQENAWPQGFGQLTQEGMMQHWKLGQGLKTRYTGFLNESYDRQEIYIRSTDCDRTLMSAEVNLAGLYPPEASQFFNPNISWQPVPVHTVPESEDRLLKFPLSNCPRYQQLQRETRQSAEYINKTQENRRFMEMVRNETGIEDASLESIWSIYDTLFCEQSHKLALPSWVTADVLNRLKDLKDFGFKFLFGIQHQAEKGRLQGGVLLGQILKNITEATNTSRPQRPKLIAYSAHDTTLVALEMALNVYNGKQPPYASCHMFELYQEDSGNFSLEMYFWNESGREPFPLALPHCPQSCPLQDFLLKTQNVITEDWEYDCQVPSINQDTAVIIALAISGAVLLLLVILLLTVLFRLHTQPMGYHHVSDDGEDQA
ncbi:lysosomal acid phosphatase [Microcaecilia unicolor]|uniref:Lysosomal acid phosphatase n=1 Tax=Microcaecilia unicolor TaxID=1415580 RepID=A0A6P7Y146_9AMPH|nr:lysosomal acid phosphatase [Microcaecilia unicolor]